MPGRTPSAAVAAYLAARRSVAACITDRPLLATKSPKANSARVLTFAPVGRPVPLPTVRGVRDIGLLVIEEYRVERAASGRTPFDIRVTGYRYHLLDGRDDELLAYHWHPTGVSPVTHPHLHLSPRLPAVPLAPGAHPLPLADLHITTGFVDLAAVVRLLITEFGVLPRRPDWPAILAAPPPAED